MAVFCKRNCVWLSCLMVGVFVGVLAATPLKAAVQNASSSTLELFNGSGQRIGFIGPGNAGQGTFFLFNPQGGVEVQMGAYDSGSEKGQTLFGLHGKNGSLRFLMRLHGPHDSPVMVMKDKAGSDKLIIGLEGYDEVPYIKYRSKNGSMVNLIQE